MGLLDGRIMPVVATATSDGPGTTSVPLRPAVSGVEWEILYAWGRQNDGAVTCVWQFLSPEWPGGCELVRISATGPDIPWDIFSYAERTPSAARLPIYATWDKYPRYAFTASAAGKIGLVAALVIERIGVEGVG